MGEDLTDANWVFDRAIQLMDEQHQQSGETRTVDTQTYRSRTLGILNVLRHELFPYSDTYELGTDGKRTVCPEIRDFTQPLALDDGIAQTVLPYGLAAQLMLGERDDMASFFQQRYETLLYTVASRRPGVWEDISIQA